MLERAERETLVGYAFISNRSSNSSNVCSLLRPLHLIWPIAFKGALSIFLLIKKFCTFLNELYIREMLLK